MLPNEGTVGTKAAFRKIAVTETADREEKSALLKELRLRGLKSTRSQNDWLFAARLPDGGKGSDNSCEAQG
jgi:hypothetical protein